MTDRLVDSHWDFEALESPVDQSAFREFRRVAMRSPEGVRVRARLVGVVPALVVLGSAAAFNAAVLVWLLTVVAFNADLTAKGFGMLGVVILGCSFWFIVDIIRRETRGLHPWRAWFRLERFAHGNGLTFAPEISPPDHQGVIFTAGEDRRTYDVMRTSDGRSVEIGNFRAVGEIGPRRVAAWGYFAIRLDRAIPHMVVESRRNRRTSLPAALSRPQVLSLEGDFDAHFTLYAPREYRSDALYVFTPDLMALLIDQAASFDLEIVDDWLYLYSRKPFDMLSRKPYELLEQLARTVGAKSVRRTSRYVDARMIDQSATTVAEPGRRLTRRLSPVFVAAFVVIGLMVVAMVWAIVVTVLNRL